ncbi:hypothetical protein Lfu02_46650 [Longispora fulva]|uniref:Ig-like domain-containing protein n=1 Tax=Longispora fulva TaxID=619741 RepID=A0A8J7GIC8_9ACTN|nr:hypothetical protein [Longispora fulva]MBG6138040.1 hypothetical protein [Longispora fulva]GIG60293.1 hypothetical protein Lfu02_46650 [Longispora fulva]
MRKSSVALAGVAMAVIAGSFVAAAPAQAAGPYYLTCESWSSTVWCEDTGPRTTITWKLNGNAVPSWNNLTSVRSSCRPGDRMAFAATRVYPGGTTTDTHSITCTNLPPR